ncbi:MAG: hypothetical protein JWR83_3465 [Aeromicrobium sp.]|nr:hypothetical protein [Aeromicrobium sp.]
MSERLVRFAQSFFDHLDDLLPRERDEHGNPSSTDFLLYDLPRIRDLLACDFERNTLAISDIPDLRVFIGAGVLVPRIAVYAYLCADDSVEVIGLSAG